MQSLVTPAARRSPTAGFTLVELMLVLALLGVLIGIVVSLWGGWRDRVKTQQAQQDIIAIAAVIDIRLTDTGELPASLAVINRGHLRDPWGNAYVYTPLIDAKGKGAARKDHSLVPLNSDYDLFSAGPDGAWASPLTAKASRDDIVRANDGRFIGPASMY